ncbi:MAG: type II secretion system protein [Candidatus Riflebacteria bacterium]|nr:type II secretion system protein [Candidatus Riflebacteria bacterium]
MATTDRRLGLTLIELIVCTVIIGVLAGTALPLSHHFVRLQKEEGLKASLRTMREAIDRYRDLQAKRNPALGEDACFPPSLEALVQARVLRRIPRDPMTGQEAWRTISTTDDPAVPSSDLANVFDVRSLATGTARDGSPYSDW